LFIAEKQGHAAANAAYAGNHCIEKGYAFHFAD